MVKSNFSCPRLMQMLLHANNVMNFCLVVQECDGGRHQHVMQLETGHWRLFSKQQGALPLRLPFPCLLLPSPQVCTANIDSRHAWYCRVNWNNVEISSGGCHYIQL